jgi:hypothetical protein
MTLQELMAEVYIITTRPDLVADTESAVKAATLKAHQLDYFSEDLTEVAVDLIDSNYKQEFGYLSTFPNFRAFKYFLRLEAPDTETGVAIDIIDIEETVDDYGYLRPNIAYIAGNVLQIRSTVAFQYADVGAYILPDVTTLGYKSWIADRYPYSIVYEAARRLFLVIGYQEQSASMTQLVAEEYRNLRASALPNVGS